MAKTVLFGRYRLEEPLGAGGSAQVWRATDGKTRETVAVKRLHPLVFGDEAGRERLVREFRALRDLDEPHVVRVRDLELTDDEGALILDFVAGPSLAQRLATGPRLSTAESVSIALDVAAALAAAHKAGIVHRDVTPGNILLDPTDGARLTDFGLALDGAGTAAEPALTATGQLVGTLRYLAPEQLRGAPASTASDVHALAAVTYEMLAGRPAYEAATPVALAEAHARSVEPIPSVPPALDLAVRQALASDPADRPLDAAAFAAAIEAAMAADRTEPIAITGPQADATSQVPTFAGAAAASGGGAVGADGDGPLWDPPDSEPGPPSPPSPPTNRPRLRAPIPAALVLGLLIAGLGLAALAPSAGRDVTATPPVGTTPASTPFATPEPRPEDEGADGAGGRNGKGKDGDKGKGNGKDKDDR
jgi:serine/threonine-protein kinase